MGLFYGSGPDTYAKEKKDVAIYESAFYPVHCGNGRQNTADAGGNDFQVQAEGYPAWNRCCDPGAERTGGSCRRPCQYGSSYVADPSDCWCGVPVFAATTLKGDDDEEENVKDRKIKFAPLSVFCTFFVAELGDKTQLTAITFGANEGLSRLQLLYGWPVHLDFCAGCDRSSGRISSEKQGAGGNSQYGCIFHFFHFWNSDTETGIRASAWSRICYDSSADSCGYSSICDRLSCAL